MQRDGLFCGCRDCISSGSGASAGGAYANRVDNASIHSYHSPFFPYNYTTVLPFYQIYIDTTLLPSFLPFISIPPSFPLLFMQAILPLLTLTLTLTLTHTRLLHTFAPSSTGTGYGSRPSLARAALFSSVPVPPKLRSLAHTALWPVHNSASPTQTMPKSNSPKTIFVTFSNPRGCLTCSCFAAWKSMTGKLSLRQLSKCRFGLWSNGRQ